MYLTLTSRKLLTFLKVTDNFHKPERERENRNFCTLDQVEQFLNEYCEKGQEFHFIMFS